MESVDTLVKATLGEIEKVLNTRTIVGEPIKIDGRTIIPLISVGFAFGAGAGQGKGEMKRMGEGTGGFSGGGAWIRPVALVILDKDSIKVESVKGGLASAFEKMGDVIPMAIEKAMGEKRKREEEEE